MAFLVPEEAMARARSVFPRRRWTAGGALKSRGAKAGAAKISEGDPQYSCMYMAMSEMESFDAQWGE